MASRARQTSAQALMARDDLIVAAGGQPMVRAAYSSGTPAYGVGAGNSTMVIDEAANIEEAARNTMLSKTSDFGWNKNGVGQQFPIYEAGTIYTPGGYATMGFGSPAALGAKLARPDRVVIALVGDGGFGQNPAVLATAAEQNIAVVWVIINYAAFGTIAGLEKAHFGTTFGTVFERNGAPYAVDYSAIAKAYGIDGVKINSAAEFKPALERAIKSNKPHVLDVIMQNELVPTNGHWNIMDIYSPGRNVHHVSTGTK